MTEEHRWEGFRGHVETEKLSFNYEIRPSTPEEIEALKGAPVLEGVKVSASAPPARFHALMVGQGLLDDLKKRGRALVLHFDEQSNCAMFGVPAEHAEEDARAFGTQFGWPVYVVRGDGTSMRLDG